MGCRVDESVGVPWGLLASSRLVCCRNICTDAFCELHGIWTWSLTWMLVLDFVLMWHFGSFVGL